MQYNEKQIQIIDAAEKLIADNGFSGTSVRDIATAANVNLAMISYYFGSKEKLLAAIFAYRIGATTIQLESLIASKNLNPFEKIDKIIAHYTDKFRKNTSFFKIMLSEQIKGNENADLEEVLFNSKKKNHDLMKALIAEGQTTGHFKQDIDVSFLMNTLIGITNHSHMSKKYYKKLNGLEGLSDEKFETLINKKLNEYLKILFKAILTYESE